MFEEPAGILSIIRPFAIEFEFVAAERLGLDEYFFGDGVSVIEWADRFPDLIPQTARWISFETKLETQRAITTE